MVLRLMHKFIILLGLQAKISHYAMLFNAINNK